MKVKGDDLSKLIENMTQRHHRRSLRLKYYDYSEPGAYFITICTRHHQCIFGEIVEGEMILNTYGKIAQKCWLDIPKHFPNVELDEFVIMPNHIHGIIIITDVGAPLAGALNKRADVGAIHELPLRNLNQLAGAQNKRAGASPAPTIGNIIGTYKSIVVNRCLKIFKKNKLYMGKLWQRNYYERILRDERELNKIREYIINNPIKWELDYENPERKRKYKNVTEYFNSILNE